MALGKIPYILPPSVVGGAQPILRVLEKGFGLNQELSCKVVMLRDWIACHGPPLTISVISGARTAEDQLELKRRGRPATTPELSTHVPKPGERLVNGCDIRVHPDTVFSWDWIGFACTAVGLRWGGGSEHDERGHPSDKNHLDTGPKWA